MARNLQIYWDMYKFIKSLFKFVNEIRHFIDGTGYVK